MTRLFLIIISTLLITSCIDVRFERAMPNEENEINRFPEELIGEYEFWDKMRETNSIVLGKSGLSIDKFDKSESETDSKNPLKIELETFDFILTNGKKKINEDFILKQLNDTCYFVSIHRTDSIESLEGYTVFPITLINEILTIYNINENQKQHTESIIERIEEITPIRSIQHPDSKESRRKRKDQIEGTKYYLINPDDSAIHQFFEKGIFSEWIYLKKI
jgi:hypothetical protein